MEESSRNWAQAEMHVMRELRRQDQEIAVTQESLYEFKETISTRVAALEVKATIMDLKQGMWGAIGSALPVIAYFLYQVFGKP